MAEKRTIRIDALTRVEGEGALNVRIQGDNIEAVELSIYEPPRFFEALLRGRPLREVPDIVARICGICPVAYQMSAVHALEAALGVTISPEVRQLRRLLYCGEWIESHGLHMHLLQVPDFFGYAGGIEMARDYPDEIRRGLQLKKHGNRLLEVLGGRAIHPVNTAVGGFYRAPRQSELQALIPDFEWGVQAAADVTRWVAGFNYPDFDRPCELVSLSHPDEYPMNEGLIATSSGRRIPVADFETEFPESQAPYSTALQASQSPSGQPYLVGPLARVGLNRDRLSETARRVADEIDFPAVCTNPYRSIIARGLELTHAFEEGLEILRDYQPPPTAHCTFADREGIGCAATEAPRGLIYHRYEISDSGHVRHANIVPPTSQNQRQIEADLRHILPPLLTGNDEQLASECERLVRSYDPCISCATHFLKVTVDRR
jgi:coenzyme F420-reducing hydrogenase alpha subunit